MPPDNSEHATAVEHDLPDAIPSDNVADTFNNNASNHHHHTLPQNEHGPPGLPPPSRPDFWNNPRPTNENPNFVRDYFASSRLHFIGSFRARYESMMVSVAKNLGLNASVLLQAPPTGPAAKKGPRVIIHMDMDAFFASVAVRDNPSLKGLPVAVCHDAGEVSSCTYEARAFGVSAGMFLREAKALCPTMRHVAYDFAAYERASVQMYTLFYRVPGVVVEAVSVDEAYLDVTSHPSVLSAAHSSQAQGQPHASNDGENPIDVVVRGLRQEIRAHTGCPASAGVGPSKLVARLATKRAKPDGQFRVPPGGVTAFLDTLSVGDLPGVGRRTKRRLEGELRTRSVPDLRAVPLARLQGLFGERQGALFHALARGVDARAVEPLRPRRSIGAELSWGVRFEPGEDDKVRTFITQVATEVGLRVSAAGATGARVVYKLYRRIRGADASHYKHLGHGPCSILTKSARLPQRSAGDALTTALVNICLSLHTDAHLANDDFRGIGIQVADLVFADLKLDPSALAPPGTRRIDSFFKTAARTVGSATARTGREAGHSQLYADASRSRDEIQPETSTKARSLVPCTSELNSNTPVSSAVREADANEHTDIVASEIQAVTDENDIVPPEDTTHASSPEESASEIQPEYRDTNSATKGDEANPAPITEDEQQAAEHASNMDVAIPNGWDRDVFLELPPDIQAELLEQQQRTSGNNAAQAGRPARGRQRTLTQNGDPTRQVGTVREREREEPAGKRKRAKKAAQMTMTQIAELSHARREGVDLLDAAEFQSKGLRDAVELLEDIKGAGNKNGLPQQQQQQQLRRPAAAVPDHETDSDIPSPPSLSSDSDGEGAAELSVGEVVARMAQKQVHRMYEEEPIVSYAPTLKEWMRKTSPDVKSGHVELLRSRLVETLKDGKLQRLCEELRTIRQFASSDAEVSGWISPFNALVSQIQQECKYEFNFNLDVKKIECE